MHMFDQFMLAVCEYFASQCLRSLFIPIAFILHFTRGTMSATTHSLFKKARTSLLTLCVFSFSPLTLAGQAAVAMPDSYSADVARQVLEDGGNAVDAAIAASFTLAVTLPEAGNIGGGGFMTAYVENTPYFLDYREEAPSKASRDMYLDDKKNVISGLSTDGVLASGVPGTVHGMWLAHERLATKPWAELVQPAIELAENGFYIHPKLAYNIKDKQNDIKGMPVNFNDYFGNVRAHQLFKQPELAATLKRIAQKGPKGFYQGKTAQLLVNQMRKNGGIISYDDLASYRAKWREPLIGSWNGTTVITAPPPSSGGIALMQLLQMKDQLSATFKGVPLNSAQYLHLIAEIEKRVYADRAEYLGDPDFIEVPTKKLLAADYISRRAAEVNPTKISPTPSINPGLPESPHTTHFSIIDGDGNAVSNTYTLNLSFGNAVVVEGAGFLLNNEMDDFSVKPGVPNAFGVIGGTANAIAPKKRMLSSMTPTIVTKDNTVRLVVGSPGGSTIITSVFQAMVNHMEYDLTPFQTVSTARYHHQLFPKDQISYSIPIPATLKADLEKRGYKTKYYVIGDVQMVANTNGALDAASDPIGRGQSYVFELNTSK